MFGTTRTPAESILNIAEGIVAILIATGLLYTAARIWPIVIERWQERSQKSARKRIADIDAEIAYLKTVYGDTLLLEFSSLRALMMSELHLIRSYVIFIFFMVLLMISGSLYVYIYVFAVPDAGIVIFFKRVLPVVVILLFAIPLAGAIHLSIVGSKITAIDRAILDIDNHLANLKKRREELRGIAFPGQSSTPSSPSF